MPAAPPDFHARSTNEGDRAEPIPSHAHTPTREPREFRLLKEGWEELGDPRSLSAIRDVSAAVSTNRVCELTLSDGHQLIAKVSSYGSFLHFRQDHDMIHDWGRQLQATRYRNFLARIVLQHNRPFVFRQGNRWLVFYEKVPFYDFLPPKLTEAHVAALGTELAHFHRASEAAASTLPPSYKTLGADLGTLHSAAGSRSWLRERGLGPDAEVAIRRHCEIFMEQSESLGYRSQPRLPVLVDWNPGNFSVGFDVRGFKFYSRWDYDWFRVEPRTLDFYFCARVVRSEGDRKTFSYFASPLLEPRFVRFLIAYHEVNPLADEEVLFLKEAYRFFILNYVLHVGEHFFRPRLRRRLQREALSWYLPRLEQLDFRCLLDALHHPRLWACRGV